MFYRKEEILQMKMEKFFFFFFKYSNQIKTLRKNNNIHKDTNRKIILKYNL